MLIIQYYVKILWYCHLMITDYLPKIFNDNFSIFYIILERNLVLVDFDMCFVFNRHHDQRYPHSIVCMHESVLYCNLRCCLVRQMGLFTVQSLAQLFQRCLMKVLHIDLWKCYLSYVRETKGKLPSYKYVTWLCFHGFKVAVSCLFNAWWQYLERQVIEISYTVGAKTLRPQFSLAFKI